MKPVHGNKNEANTQKVPLSARYCNGDPDMQLIAAGWMGSTFISEVSGQQRSECMIKRCLKGKNGESLYLLDNVIFEVAIKHEHSGS